VGRDGAEVRLSGRLLQMVCQETEKARPPTVNSRTLYIVLSSTFGVLTMAMCPCFVTNDDKVLNLLDIILSMSLYIFAAVCCLLCIPH